MFGIKFADFSRTRAIGRPDERSGQPAAEARAVRVTEPSESLPRTESHDSSESLSSESSGSGALDSTEPWNEGPRAAEPVRSAPFRVVRIVQLSLVRVAQLSAHPPVNSLDSSESLTLSRLTHSTGLSHPLAELVRVVRHSESESLDSA